MRYVGFTLQFLSFTLEPREASYEMSQPTCVQVDRTTMGLFYSGNAFDWWTAGIIDYHLVSGAASGTSIAQALRFRFNGFWC